MQGGCGIILYLMKKHRRCRVCLHLLFAIEIGELIPSGIFLLLALVLPLCVLPCGRRLFAPAAKTSARVALHFDRELLKAAGLGTAPDAAFCGGGAAAPVQKHAAVASFLGTLSTLLNIYFLALGARGGRPPPLLPRVPRTTGPCHQPRWPAFLENIFRALVLLFAGIAMLDTMGVPVTGLLTGAGVAGIAISLAAQSTLSNLIAGVALVLEHPFGIGDYIVLGSLEGTVEDISFRSTKFRTLDNVVVSIENSKVASSTSATATSAKSR